MNREDWNDGYDYARFGLNSFKIETDTDKKIYNEILEITSKDDVDGRYFRYCSWNYNVLFSMCEHDILKNDYIKVSEALKQSW